MRQQGAKQNSQQSIKTKKPVSASSQVVTPPPLSNQRSTTQNRSLSPAPSKYPPRNTRSRNSNTISDNHPHLPALQPRKGLQQQQHFQQTQPQQQQQIQPQHFSQSLPHRIPISEKIISEDYPFEQINNLVHEYLLKNNMVKTLDTFQDELTQPLPPYDQSRGYEFQLMEHFKRGQREQFFMKWNRFLPLSMLVGDEKVTRLEFYLQIFFFIFPIHPFFKRSTQVDAESIAVFKEYLDTRGAALSKTSEFLHFYALPYIPKPQEHPALKHLFTNEWIENVRQQLNEFLASVYDNQPLPQLFYVYQSYLYSDKDNGNSIVNESNNSKELQQLRRLQGDKSNSIVELENENRELVNVVKQFNERYMILLNQNKVDQAYNKQIIMESHQKWIITANELVQISKELKSMIDGNIHQGIAFQEEPLAMLQNRIQNYEVFLNTNLEELVSKAQDIQHFDNKSFISDPEHQLNSDQLLSPQPLNFVTSSNFQFNSNEHNTNPMQYVNPYCALDFNKIKATIIQQDDIVLCCTLLQALRWRVSKARGAYVRREIIISYANFDVIGCQNPENIPLQTGLFKKNHKIQEFSLRLINAMASDFYGRTYLIQSPTLSTLLIDIIRKEKSDTFTRRHALGALQKLSLRRKPQKAMINQDLIHWIVQTLREEKDTLSEYSYEYATALFMNLSLRSSGKLKCEDPKEGVLNVLNDLLEHENMQVRTFVNGTLYSLLGRQSLREQANAMGMSEILSYLKETSDERFTKQIQYIMDQLTKQGNQDEGNESDSNEEDNDVDDIDDEEEVGEEEQADDVIDIPQENNNNQRSQQKQSNGEGLLEGQFCLIGQEGVKQLNQCRKIMMESHQNRMLSSANTQGGGGQYSSYHRGMNMDVPFNRPATPSMSASYISHTQKTSYNVARTQQPSQQQQRSQNNSQNGGNSNNSVSRPKSNATQNGETKDIQPIITINQLNEEEIKNLPSEMQSRPKILRTPAGGERQRIQELQKQHEYQLQQSYVEQAITYPVQKKEKNKPKDKEKEQGSQLSSSFQQKQSESEQPKSAPSAVLPVDVAIKPSEGQVVIEQAFDSKPKIPRTPPGLQK